MIVRTAPALPSSPDSIRAMERLEAQLRRAADDLAEALGAIRDAEINAAIEAVPPWDERQCGVWMPLSRERCGRRKEHRGGHRSRSVMDDEAVRRARGRAA